MTILNFSKDSDTVPHCKLLHKLDNGVRGNIQNWNSPVLTKRQQRVINEGEISSACKVASGVPQGTVLVPFMFLCHINDLPQNISSQIRLFVDDCLFCKSLPSPEDHHMLQNITAEMGEHMGDEIWRNKVLHHVHPLTQIPPSFSYSLNDHTLDIFFVWKILT